MTAERQWRGAAIYSLVVIAMVGGVGWLLTFGFSGPGDAAAIRLSGIVVVVIQVAGFMAIKLLGSQRVLLGWGIMAVLRLVTLVVFAVLVAKVLQMPLTSALLSMATFFFLTTSIEPLLLRL